ncbi:hypothetical protein [Wielerella bovis]|uniref:hypothetical protein n=1 Tax=Wielerella bovis TaxID=2917790 RepID=UPI00201A0CAF|nr:hypothetical protein [Wielerella bovis]ULJ61197.1 hypothetical protein MIS44_04940 [Wielerella bovis]
MKTWFKQLFTKQDKINISLTINKLTDEQIKKIITDEVSENTKQENIWSIMAKLTQILSLLIPLSILIGSILIYFYLDKLGAVGLFSEIISTPSSLISIIIMFVVIIFAVFFIPFYTPYLFIQTLKENEISGKKHLWWLSFVPTIIFIIYFVLNIYSLLHKNNIKNDGYFIFFIIYTLVPAITLYFAINLGTKKIMKCIEAYLMWFLLNFSHCLFIIYVASAIFNWLSWENGLSIFYSVLFLLLSMFLYGLNMFNLKSILAKKIYSQNYWIYPTMSIFFIGVFTIFSMPYSHMHEYLFQKLSYIEKPQDARWYLLDTRFINQNGLVKKEGTTGLNDSYMLPKWQNKFLVLPKVNNTIYFDLITQKQLYYIKNYKNAMYGYMAWNLGKTKLFCPHDVNINSAKQSKTTLDKICLTINGDYLQPIPENL